MPENGNRTTIWPRERVTGKQEVTVIWVKDYAREELETTLWTCLNDGWRRCGVGSKVGVLREAPR